MMEALELLLGTSLAGVYDSISEWPPLDPCGGDRPIVVVTAFLNSASLTALPAAPGSWITLTGFNLADTPI